MSSIDTLGDEKIVVSDPRFGRIATVRLDHLQAAELANALARDRARDEDVA